MAHPSRKSVCGKMPELAGKMRSAAGQRCPDAESLRERRGLRPLPQPQSAQLPFMGRLLVSADLTSDRTLSATSKVATLHRRDCSLSVELSTNEISATGGHLCFVHRRLSEVRPAGEGRPSPIPPAADASRRSYQAMPRRCLRTWLPARRLKAAHPDAAHPGKQEKIHEGKARFPLRDFFLLPWAGSL